MILYNLDASLPLIGIWGAHKVLHIWDASDVFANAARENGLKISLRIPALHTAGAPDLADQSLQSHNHQAMLSHCAAWRAPACLLQEMHPPEQV